MALALEGLPRIADPRVLVGHNHADDAGVMRIDDSLALVTTVDLLAPVVDDPREFGFIAATNCLSDVYAMGGDPLACLNVVGWPTAMSPDVLGEIMAGGQEAVVQAGAVVIGGHTFQSAEIRYGLAITGRIDPARIYTNTGARPGDALILTKPLGTGTVIQCAISRGAAPEEAFKAAVASMKTSNATAAAAVRELGANACTDVTGFSFLGHGWELAAASKVGIRIDAAALPTFPMVRELILAGIVDGSHKMNMNSFQQGVRFERDDPALATLLYSSETSGGLLIAVAHDDAGPLLARLHEAGLPNAAVVGTVVAQPPGVVTVG
ncbi:MAG: selenide, water dikinase SelD [Kiritimatiellae bacterium]|nr:selenide, water dikinase SelD [Kiritimatiellia bacterium]